MHLSSLWVMSPSGTALGAGGSLTPPYALLDPRRRGDAVLGARGSSSESVKAGRAGAGAAWAGIWRSGAAALAGAQLAAGPRARGAPLRGSAGRRGAAERAPGPAAGARLPCLGLCCSLSARGSLPMGLAGLRALPSKS